MLTAYPIEWGLVLLPALAAAWFAAQPRRRDALVRSLVVLAFVAHASRYWAYTVDDSFITFRFARSWLAGLGPVYQTGPRVEGITSFGWMALLTLAGRMGADLVVASKVLGLAAAASALVAVHAMVRRCGAGDRVAFATMAVLALDPLYASWSVAGMDTPLFAAMLAWATWSRLANHRVAGLPLSAILFGLGVWTRPEGFLFGTIAWLTLAASRKEGALRDALRWALVATACALPFWLWRWSYYGSFFPNTYYAKMPELAVRLAAGLATLRDFVLESGPWKWLPPVASLARLRVSGAPERLLWLLVGAFLAYVAWGGGDVLHLRFFAHVLPLVAVLWGAGVATVVARRPAAVPEPAESTRRGRAAKPAPSPRPRSVGAAVAAALVLVAALGGLAALRFARTQSSRAQFGAGYVVNNARNLTEVNRPLGEWLQANAPAGSTLATWDIGIVGWTSGLPILDLYGLTDGVIAHQIHSRAPVQQRIDYVLAARPELIATYARPEGPVWSWLAPAEDSLLAAYRYHSLWRAPSSGYGLVLLARNDVELPRLAAAAPDPAAPPR